MELGLWSTELEVDAEVNINTLKREEECLAWYGDLIEEAKFNMRSHPQWKISFIHRERNGAAHALAKHELFVP